MRRRSFLATLTTLFGATHAYTATAQEQEPTRYLTPGRSHTLLASEVADGITLRNTEGHSTLVIDFKRYDSPEMIFRATRLGALETSGGVYVRGPVPFSVRFVPGTVVPQGATGIVFSHRAWVRVYRERDSTWPTDVAQVIVVATTPGIAPGLVSAGSAPR
jgi:hypothetical protein